MSHQINFEIIIKSSFKLLAVCSGAGCCVITSFGVNSGASRVYGGGFPGISLVF